MGLVETLTAISLLLGIAAVLGKWLVLNPLKAFIKEQTYPIQPNANGGRSLPDIASAVARIERRLDEHLEFHSKEN